MEVEFQTVLSSDLSIRHVHRVYVRVTLRCLGGRLSICLFSSSSVLLRSLSLSLSLFLSVCLLLWSVLCPELRFSFLRVFLNWCNIYKILMCDSSYVVDGMKNNNQTNKYLLCVSVSLSLSLFLSVCLPLCLCLSFSLCVCLSS